MSRRGLVLGGGGVLGAAWTVGAVTALEQVHGVDVREFDELVGTSAGAVLASLLAAGVSVAELREHQPGGRLTTGPLADLPWDRDTATGATRPPTPKVGLTVPGVLRQGFKHWRQLPPTAGRGPRRTSTCCKAAPSTRCTSWLPGSPSTRTLPPGS